MNYTMDDVVDTLTCKFQKKRFTLFSISFKN